MRGGSMIRLIDIVFILLFGFISISEISHKSKIELPRSAETPASNPDREHVFFLGIDSQGNYLVEDEARVVRGAPALLSYLGARASEARAQGESLRVRIRSNWNAPIKFTMAAADICDHLQIAKGIDVRRVTASR